MKRNHRIGPDQFIYIDFEGEGKKTSKPADEQLPHPTLLGARFPRTVDSKAVYKVWLFEEVLGPMTKPKLPGRPVLATLDEAITNLLEVTDQNGLRLAYFSYHEQRVVDRFVPHLSADFEQRSFNIKAGTDSIAKKRLPKGTELSLDETCRVLLPNRTFRGAPCDGAADACRRLRTAGKRSSRWRSWTENEQAWARQLLEYNRDDCRSLHHLVNVVRCHRPRQLAVA